VIIVVGSTDDAGGGMTLSCKHTIPEEKERGGGEEFFDVFYCKLLFLLSSTQDMRVCEAKRQCF